MCRAIGFVGVIRSSAYWREMKDAGGRVKVAGMPPEQTRDNLDWPYALCGILLLLLPRTHTRNIVAMQYEYGWRRIFVINLFVGQQGMLERLNIFYLTIIHPRSNSTLYSSSYAKRIRRGRGWWCKRVVNRPRAGGVKIEPHCAAAIIPLALW